MDGPTFSSPRSTFEAAGPSPLPSSLRWLLGRTILSQHYVEDRIGRAVVEANLGRLAAKVWNLNAVGSDRNPLPTPRFWPAILDALSTP